MGYLYFEKVIPALILLWDKISDLFILFYLKIRWLVEYVFLEFQSHF